jgi:hypothetical protein
MHAELHDQSNDFLYLDSRRPTLLFVGRNEETDVHSGL